MTLRRALASVSEDVRPGYGTEAACGGCARVRRLRGGERLVRLSGDGEAWNDGRV